MQTNFHLQLTDAPTGIAATASPLANKQAVALGETAGPSSSRPAGGPADSSNRGAMSDEDELQARLDALRRG